MHLDLVSQLNPNESEPMGHYSSCANAQRHICRCGQCGGALHAWPSRLELALSAPEERSAFREAINETWEFYRSKRRSGSPPSAGLRAAGIDSAVIDIVDFLAEHPTTIKDVQQAGNLLTVAAKKGPTERNDKRTLAENHFWCELLVQIAIILKEVNHLTEETSARIISRIFSPSDGSAAVLAGYKRLLEPTVATLWTGFIRLPYIIHTEQALLATRMLAILICPSPEEHRSVREYCLGPLSTEALSDVTRARLQQLFTEDWTSQLYEALAS